MVDMGNETHSETGIVHTHNKHGQISGYEAVCVDPGAVPSLQTIGRASIIFGSDFWGNAFVRFLTA